jgi:hypothetical protein
MAGKRTPFTDATSYRNSTFELIQYFLQELIIVIFFYTMTKNLTLFFKKPGKVIGGGCRSI